MLCSFMVGFSPNWDNLNFIRNQYSSEVLLRTRMPTIARMDTAKKYEEKCQEILYHTSKVMSGLQKYQNVLFAWLIDSLTLE